MPIILPTVDCKVETLLKLCKEEDVTPDATVHARDNQITH